FDGPFEGRTGVVERSFLSLDVAGTVAEVLAPAGSRLEAGLPIVRIEPGDARDQLQPAETELQQARRDARRAQARFDREQRLAARNPDRTEPLSTARERLEAANEAVDALTQRLNALQRQARDGLLLAPFAGSVAEIRVGVGEQVAPGQAVAVYYAASAPIVVEGKLPAALAPKTHLHQSAFVHFAALESLTVRGRVIA